MMPLFVSENNVVDDDNYDIIIVVVVGVVVVDVRMTVDLICASPAATTPALKSTMGTSDNTSDSVSIKSDSQFTFDTQ
jgi:hypothetical protein